MVNPQFFIVGAGPAGLCAGIAAAEQGVSVLIVDEGFMPGGQLPKQTHKFFGHKGFFASVRGFDIAHQLVERAEKAGVEIRLETSVAGIYEDCIALWDRKKDHVWESKPERILIATGASERFIPFENNLLVGIYGAGAVQTLMNQYGVLPGKDFLIVGSGNIGLIVGYQLVQAGARVKAIVDIASKIGGYEVHSRKIERLGIPILLNHTIVKAIGKQKVRGAVIAPVNDQWKPIASESRELFVDSICLAVGLQPSVELAAQSGSAIEYIPALGGYIPVRDPQMRTTIPTVFVAGDISSIEEASTAMMEGFIAGFQVAQDLTGTDMQAKMSNMRDELTALRRGPFSSKVREGLGHFGIHFPSGGYRTETQTETGPFDTMKALIECPQCIPCNPCETSCPTKAIEVGGNLNGIPWVNYEACTGCGICAMICPGLAIFMVQKKGDKAVIGIPYELLPLPEKEDVVFVQDRKGQVLGEATVIRVMKNEKEKTHLVFIEVPIEWADTVRSVQVPEQKKNDYICRCEEVTVEEIERAIDMGYTDYEELRRYLRIGMGPCGGRVCRAQTLQILSSKLEIPIAELEPGTFRAPSIPLPFRAIRRGETDE